MHRASFFLRLFDRLYNEQRVLVLALDLDNVDDPETRSSPLRYQVAGLEVRAGDGDRAERLAVRADEGVPEHLFAMLQRSGWG